MKYRKLLYFLALFVLTNLQTVAQTDGGSNLLTSEELYEVVLESVFPRTALDSDPGFGLVLRFSPSFHAESQISIEKKGAKFTITEYQVIGDSIYDRLYDLKPVGQYQVAPIAATMPVSVKVVTIDSKRVNRWIREFSGILTQSLQAENLFFAKNPTEIIQMDDGTRYEMWYKGRYQLYYRRQGTGLRFSKPSEDPVIRWMKRMSLAVAAESKMQRSESGRRQRDRF